MADTSGRLGTDSDNDLNTRCKSNSALLARAQCCCRWGDPTSQADHAHQLICKSFDGPGLSFSTDEQVARYFAINGGLVSGVVYAVRARHLASLVCGLFYQHEHTAALQNPEEGEVVVVPPMGVELTLCDVDRIFDVE